MRLLPALSLLLLSTLSLNANDFRFMALSSHDTPDFLLGDDKLMERNFSLTPWPWERENIPFDLVGEIDDLILNHEGNMAEGYALDRVEELFFERLDYLWPGKIGLSFNLTEEVVDKMKDGEFRKSLVDSWKDFPCDEIVWAPHLSPARTDFTDVESFISEWDKDRNTTIPLIYSMGRQEKPLPFLWDRADFVIIEAYDFSGRHSTFENAEEAVENFILRKGQEPALLILGIPLYGRKYKSSDPEYWISKLPYYRIIETYHPIGESNEVDNYYFNNPAMAVDKTALAEEKGLGGIALFPVEWDSRGSSSLGEAISSYLRNGD